MLPSHLPKPLCTDTLQHRVFFLLQHIQIEAALHKRCCGRQVAARDPTLYFSRGWNFHFRRLSPLSSLSRFRESLSAGIDKNELTNNFQVKRGEILDPAVRGGRGRGGLFSAAAKCHEEVETHNVRVSID